MWPRNSSRHLGSSWPGIVCGLPEHILLLMQQELGGGRKTRKRSRIHNQTAENGSTVKRKEGGIELGRALAPQI